MPKCRNPECVNGLCPGVKILSKGKTSAPLFGDGGTHKADPMRWAWVNCLSCNPKPKDPPYKHVVRPEAERKQRAAWASEGVPYRPDSETAARLSRVAAKANGGGSHSAPAPSPDNSELMSKIDKLVEGQAELLDQIKELRAENKELKAENARLKSSTVAN
jgi:hypothetical protein